MNSARLHKVFQNFVVPWKIHLYKNLILSSDASRQDASNGIRVAYVNFYHKWVLRHGLRLYWSYNKSQNTKRLTIPQSITPPIWPGTRADHGADSAAGHPGRMWNRFRSFRCSWVHGSKVRKWFCGAQMSPPNHLHLDPFLSSSPPNYHHELIVASDGWRSAHELPVAHHHPIIVVVEATSSCRAACCLLPLVLWK
jgi:hypothetical protein